MSTTTLTGKLSNNTSLSALLLLLAACGGGGQGTAPQALSASPQLPEPTPLPPAPVEAMAAPPAPAGTTPPTSILAEPATLAMMESIVLSAAYTPLVQGTINAKPYWPVWWGTGKPVDGVNCLVSGKNHLHSLISIYKDGKRLGFPDGIGRVHAGCYHAYELHVHDVTGIIHMETDVPKRFKLGQWFSLWQQPLSRDNAAGLPGPIRYYVIEKETVTRWDGNPHDIDMLPHREVLIVSGSAMSVAPRYKWPPGI